MSRDEPLGESTGRDIGKRKKHHGVSPGYLSSLKSVKQPRIEDCFAQKGTVSKINFPSTSNKFEAAEWEFQMKLGKQQLLEVFLPVREELNGSQDSCVWATLVCPYSK